MSELLSIIATGMHVAQKGIEVVSNNLSNMNTNGYKAQRVNFEDLMYQPTEGSQAVGLGSAASVPETVFTPQEPVDTNNPSDIAINGDGFFEVDLPSGDRAYTRIASWGRDDQGYMTINGDQNRLSAAIQIPDDAKQVSIHPNGEVWVSNAFNDKQTMVGKIELARFPSPGKLTSIGQHLYLANDTAGQALYGTPGEGNFGSLRQGAIEPSNVDMSEQMLKLMAMQQQFQSSARVEQVVEQCEQTTNDIGKS